MPTTDYTNGYNLAKVTTALLGRLGWKQPTQTEFAIIDAPNLASTSGRYFNDGSFHPLVTIPNIKATCDDENISDVNFNAQLVTMQKSIIMQALTAVFNRPELIEQTLLFERGLTNDQQIANGGNFVGIRFKLAPTNIAMQILSLSLYFNAAKTFNLYLFHDTKKAQLQTIPVTTVADDAVIVELDNLFLNNLIGPYKSGFFYLGYFQNDIVPAIAYYEQKARYARANGFDYDFFQAPGSAGVFDHVNVGITSQNYGMNAEIKTFHDHTASIIRNAHLFDDVVGLQMAYHVVKQVIYAVRSNRSERILKDALDKYGIIYEIEGAAPVPDVPKSTGLKQRIDQALKSLNQSFFPAVEPQSVSLC